MDNLAFDTLNMNDLFNNNYSPIKGEFIFHIPHSSTYIPNNCNFIVDAEAIENEIHMFTDWHIDKIFNVKNVTEIIAPYSRLFCDVERLLTNEPMEKYGRGFYYTKTSDGQELRISCLNYVNHVREYYYNQHHKKLSDLVHNKLNLYNRAIIIDCHSFLETSIIGNAEIAEFPDICIGTDEFHTPKFLIDIFVDKFKSLGYSVEINKPFSGTMIPQDNYMKNPNVQGIMIEINKRLYMHGNATHPIKLMRLNEVISSIFETLT